MHKQLLIKALECTVCHRIDVGTENFLTINNQYNSIINVLFIKVCSIPNKKESILLLCLANVM